MQSSIKMQRLDGRRYRNATCSETQKVLARRGPNMEIRENRKKTETKPTEKKISSDVVPLQSHSTLVGMQKRSSHLEDNAAFSYKTKHTLTI